MTRVLVTGATGFVGKEVVARLAQAGMALTLATRRSVPAPVSGDVRIVEVGPIGARTEWGAALADVATVVHLAARAHVLNEREIEPDRAFAEVNHYGTLRLFEQAAQAGVELFVFLSSIAVLGAGTRPGEPFTDRSPAGPVTPYGRSKLAAETSLAKAAAGSRTRVVTLRPPLIYGPGVKGNLGRLLRLAAVPVPLPFGGIRNRRTLLSLDNMASAILTVVQRPQPSPADAFLIGDRDPVSTSDIIAWIREGFGRRPSLFRVPAPVFSLPLSLIGAEGLYQRLFSDLEVDSSGFRQTFGWDDVSEPAEVIRAMARSYLRQLGSAGAAVAQVAAKAGGSPD